MQTTLDCNNTSSVQVTVDAVRNSTLSYTDEHLDYLYEHFSSERSIQRQIEKKLEDEENERNDILDMDAFNRSYEKGSYKPVEYIRVGKK